MNSIKTFLLIVTLASLTLMIFLSALNGYRDSLIKAEQLFDSELADKAQLLSISLSDTSIKRNIEQKKTNIDFFVFQVWKDNKLILHSLQSPSNAIAPFQQGFNDRNFLSHRWRTYSHYNQDSDLWILTAERMDIRYSLAENIILESVLPVVIMLPLLGILIWTIISYGLSPLRKLAGELGSKRADDLSPLAIDKQPVELKQVVNSTNDLLYRLKSSFQREKRFASDAAHELRTPISAIKIHLHNLSKNIPAEDHSFKQLQLSVDRMGHLVEQILDLNRTSHEKYITRFKTLDLYNLAQEVIAREYPQFDKKNLQIALEGEHCDIEGDPFALDVLLQNLLTNACKYTPEGGSVLVSVLVDKANVELLVQDSGPGVPEEQYKRLFDRFYRLNGDCHDSGTLGCGLGLAIVKQIVELHHAKISLGHSSFSSGLLVNIEFPTSAIVKNNYDK